MMTALLERVLSNVIQSNPVESAARGRLHSAKTVSPGHRAGVTRNSVEMGEVGVIPQARSPRRKPYRVGEFGR